MEYIFEFWLNIHFEEYILYDIIKICNKIHVLYHLK